MIDILVQVACKHFKDEIGNDPIVFLDSNRKETTHFEYEASDMHPSSFHLWSSKYPTEKRSRLSRGLLGPHAGIITPKEDELVKYFITKPEETLP